MTLVGVGVGTGFPRARAPRLPVKVPGCEFWLCGNTVSVGGSNDIFQAGDLSSNGRVHVQPTAANRPTLDPGPPELMVFDDTGTAQYLAGPSQSLLSNTPFAIIVLAELSGTTPDLIYGSLNAQPNNVGIFDNYIEYAGNTPGFARNTAMVTRTLWHDGTKLRYRQDGVELVSVTTPVAILSSNALGLGGVAVASGMKARSAVAYAAALTLSQVQTVELWLQAECGV